MTLWSSETVLNGVRTASGNSETRGVAACSWQQGRIDVCVVADDGRLRQRWSENYQWQGWTDLGCPPCGLTSRPTVTSWGPGRLDVFVRGGDNALWHIWYDHHRWSTWESLGGVLTSAPAAAAWGAGRLDVFVRSSDNALWHIWYDHHRWFTWESLGGVLRGSPSVASWGPGRLDVFARGTDDAVWQRYWDGSRWPEWLSLQGTISAPPAIAAPCSGALELLVPAPGGALYRRIWRNHTGWSGWLPAGRTVDGEVAAVFARPGRLELFSTRADGTIAHVGLLDPSIDNARSRYAFTSGGYRRWKDTGSGGDQDVSFFIPFAAGPFRNIGNYVQRSHDEAMHEEVMVLEPAGTNLAPPIRYERVWTDSGSGATYNGSVWRPIPPPGYVALGHVINGDLGDGYTGPSKPYTALTDIYGDSAFSTPITALYAAATRRGWQEPSLDRVWCVRADLVTEGDVDFIYHDRGSGADADLSCWKVRARAGTEANVIVPNTFVGVPHYNRPDFPVYVLRRLPCFVPG
jgi:hypothetical protein